MLTPSEHKTVQAHILAYAGNRLALCAACGGGEAVGISPSTRALTLASPRGRGDEERGEGEYCSRPNRRRALSLFDSKYAQRTDLNLGNYGTTCPCRLEPARIALGIISNSRLIIRHYSRIISYNINNSL